MVETKKIEISNKEANTLKTHLAVLVNNIESFGNCLLCRYIATKVYIKADEILHELDEMLKPTGKFQEYLDKYNDIINKYAKKDKNGNLVYKDNQVVFVNEQKANRELEKLNKQYKDVLDKRKAEVQDIQNNILNKSFTIELPLVPLYQLKDIPAFLFTFLVKYDLVMLTDQKE